MTIDPTFATQLYTQPWAILPTAFGDLVNQVISPSQRADDIVGGVGYENRPIYPQVEVVGNIAIVKFRGIIGRHIGIWEQYYGMGDSALLQEQLRNVRDDTEVEIVVLDIKTPGGVALGLEETSATIREVSAAGKPVIAWVDSLAASAGYFIASACDAIYADPSAMVGSISTIMFGVDSSKRWEEKGLKLKLFTSGAFKALGMAGKEWTPEEEAYMNERLKFYDDQFKNFVRSRRPVNDDHMQGQSWQAKEVEGLLVDGYAESLAELVADLLS